MQDVFSRFDRNGIPTLQKCLEAVAVQRIPTQQLLRCVIASFSMMDMLDMLDMLDMGILTNRN